MEKTGMDRRKFIFLTAAAGGAFPASRLLAGTSPVEDCRKIKYPGKGLTMFKMQDIGDIGQVDALILAYEVARAQNSYTGDVILGLLRDQARLPADPLSERIDAQERSLKAATLAWRETRHEKLRAEWTLGVLCMSVGKVRSPLNPRPYSASLMRPYLDDGIYRGILNQDAYAVDPSRFASEPWSVAAARIQEWDQRAVNESFAPMPLEKFAPMLRHLVSINLLFKRPINERVMPDPESPTR